MKRLLIASALLFATNGSVSDCAAEPQWIWSAKTATQDAPAGMVAFRLAFKLNSISKAAVEVASDNRFTLYVNGQSVGSGDNWQELKRFEIAKLLKPGINVVAIEAANDGGPAGLVVRSEIKDTGGVPTDIATSDAWKFSAQPEDGWRDASFDDAKWSKAISLGALGKTPPWSGGTAVAVAEAATEAPPELPAPTSPLELRDGERVAFVGGTFIERLQNFGYVEAQLTAAHPDRHVCFRNLGWSGDNVWGESRAVFGSANDGFQRLLKDLRQTRPTLIYVAYGANEAQAGQAGLDNFKAGLKRMLAELTKIQPRIVLLSPLRRENIGQPLPDQVAYNRDVKLYADAIAAEAQARKLPYVDLLDLVGNETGKRFTGNVQLTDNGVHLTPYGQWRLAPEIAERLTGQEIAGTSAMTIDGQKALSPNKVTITAKRLPRAPAPRPLPEGGDATLPQVWLKVTGLEPGKYEVHIDGKNAIAADATTLEKGVALANDPNIAQEAKLRSVIAAKDELFFHRHRPQNETYLFLFRKGEQGNNAVEIPQFDPLIEEQEQEIAKLRVPQPHEFEIIRTK
jgi:lysophospholipase L1-like esterase